MLWYKRVNEKELQMYKNDSNQLISLLWEVKELRSSCSRKDELIASYAKFVDEAKKLFDEKSALLESTYKEEIESLKKELDMYISLKEEMESFQWMKSDVLSSLKEDDLSWIPNEYKEMFIEWIEKTKYRMLESIAKITEKQAHIIYKNWAIVFANIILKDALWSLSYINNNIDAVTLQQKTQSATWKKNK